MTLLFVFGPPAVGKMTVGRAIAERLSRDGHVVVFHDERRERNQDDQAETFLLRLARGFNEIAARAGNGSAIGKLMKCQLPVPVVRLPGVANTFVHASNIGSR